MTSSKWREFIPESYLRLKEHYTLSLLRKDSIAGMTVALIAMPLSIALAIASGATPIQGLLTAVVAGFLTSALGSSRVQIGGPSAALIVVVYSIVKTTGYNGLYLSMLLASLFLIILGICKLGSWIKYIPLPLITGCTSGIAVSVFALQIQNFAGIQLTSAPSDFIQAWTSYFDAFSTIHPYTLLMGIGSLVIILLIQRFVPKIPWGLFVIVLTTGICFFFDLSIATIETQFGHFPRDLPIPKLPSFSIPPGQWPQIFGNAVTIAFLVSIESLISALIGERLLKGDTPRSNCELIAQGISNMASAFFGGIPAAGAIPRTAANVETGGKTPVAGIVHALTLFCLLFFFFSLVSQIPLTVLSAILIVICWKMFDITLFSQILKAPYGDRIILIVSFLLTTFIDIKAGILIGVTLATFIFMRQMSKASKAIPLSAAPDSVKIYEIQGPFFFGNDHILKKIIPSKVLILQMPYVTLIDVSGIFALQELHEKCKKMNAHLLLSELLPQPLLDLKNFGFIDLIHKENIFPDLLSAKNKADELLL
ncbi:MAG: SulP family inorganic anion transporter [Chlamydiota bacterium]